MVRITMTRVLRKKTKVIQHNKLLKRLLIHLIPLINKIILTIIKENITKFKKKLILTQKKMKIIFNLLEVI